MARFNGRRGIEDHFADVSKMACFNSGHRIDNRFVNVTEMVGVGKGDHFVGVTDMIEIGRGGQATRQKRDARKEERRVI